MRIGIVGGAGRMGRQLIAEVLDHSDLTLAGAVDHPNSVVKNQDLGILAGKDATGQLLTTDTESLFQKSDAIIDFTAPSATMQFTALAAQHKIIHVVGTTGLNAEQEHLLQQTAQVAPVIYAANYSVGVNLLAGLVEQAAKILPPEDFDIEIWEAHHKHKVDAPSGTALALGKAAAKGRGIQHDKKAAYARHGHTGAREDGTIGYSVARGGDIVGDHRVLFAGLGEQIELRHTATDRRIFARGALRAALWARTQRPGLYSMRDVLGL